MNVLWPESREKDFCCCLCMMCMVAAVEVYARLALPTPTIKNRFKPCVRAYDSSILAVLNDLS